MRSCVPKTWGYDIILSRISWTSLGSGACPNSGLMASRTRPRPLMQMKMPTPRPAQPSRSKPVACEISAATRPSSMTAIRSAFRTVDSRWAMMMVVRP